MSKYYDLDKLKELIEAKAETLIGDGAIAFHAVGKWLDFLPAADVATVQPSIDDVRNLPTAAPVEDAVSRETLLDGLAIIAKAKARSDAQKSLMGRVMFFTEQLPPVAPKQRWIPVSERLPKTHGVYNVTRRIDGADIADSCFYDGQGTWYDDTRINHERKYLHDITAWMPLPKPYKEGESE